ncbi:MAG TPA: helix-turn-helix transcriptional regulator [Polyangiaceae bacterium]
MASTDTTDEAPSERELNPKLEELPRRIKFARGLYSWSQVDLAERSGVNQSSISRYETGERLVSVTADSLIRIAEATRVSLVWLATGEGPVFGENGPTVTMTEPPSPKGKTRT